MDDADARAPDREHFASMRPVPAIARSQFGVFTAQQALAGGWTPPALQHCTSTGELVRLRRGVYTARRPQSGIRQVRAVETLRLQAAALALANPRVPVSHTASASLLGLELLDAPEDVCITVPRGRRGRIPGAHVHRGRLFPRDVVAVGRLMMTSPARTWLDLGREHGVDAAIVAADSALRRGLCTPADLARVLAHASGWPGVRATAVALPLADPRPESALESVSRLRISQAGLPPPEPQVRILTAGGAFIGRVDLYWDEFGVVGESDGMGKYDGVELPLAQEKHRQGLLEDAGLTIVRWGWRDLADFAATAARLERAFARGLRPGDPSRRWQARPTAWHCGMQVS